MTREERKAANLLKKQQLKEERAEARKELKAWNWLIRNAKKKGALVEETIAFTLSVFCPLPDDHRLNYCDLHDSAKQMKSL
jgi:hypothetical protein